MATIDNGLNYEDEIYRCLYSFAEPLPDVKAIAAKGKANPLTLPKGALSYMANSSKLQEFNLEKRIHSEVH